MKCPNCGGTAIEEIYRPSSNTLRKLCQNPKCMCSWQETPRQQPGAMAKATAILREPRRDG